ncbi:MAG TPA: HAMP domain-containing protein, partial [Kofleriaceae bacterium]
MTRTPQLKTRLAIAGLLLIATTVATGVWSAIAFRRVSRVVGETVTANERITDATTTLAGALELEDDALVLVLNARGQSRVELAHQRTEVDGALEKVILQLDGPAVAARLCAAIDAYQAAVDDLTANAEAADARTRYHEWVNPLLRRAVEATTEIRDQHFRSSQRVAEWAGEQATRSMQIVAAISIGGLLLLVLIVVHLARVVMVPLGEMTRAVDAIRRGEFSQRVSVQRDDELGRLGQGLNRMADELEEFRRTNIGEVIHAKETLEATLEALPDAVLVIDSDRKVSAANPRAVEALGPSREQTLDELAVAEPT